MGDEEIHQLIRVCISQDRKSQKMLYKAFYGFAMAICLRYANNRDDAAEVMNQGFMKVFTKIETFDLSKPFKVVYAEELENADNVNDGTITDSNLNYQDLLAMVQQLPQSYRTVFNLFAIDGYSHEEIADMLNVSIGTSKSNLFKARQKLKQMILTSDYPASNGDYNSRIDFTSVVAINVAATKPIYYNNGIQE